MTEPYNALGAWTVTEWAIHQCCQVECVSVETRRYINGWYCAEHEPRTTPPDPDLTLEAIRPRTADLTDADVFAVACPIPWCGAQIGERCEIRGRARRAQFHAGRRDIARLRLERLSALPP